MDFAGGGEVVASAAPEHAFGDTGLFAHADGAPVGHGPGDVVEDVGVGGGGWASADVSPPRSRARVEFKAPRAAAGGGVGGVVVVVGGGDAGGGGGRGGNSGGGGGGAGSVMGGGGGGPDHRGAPRGRVAPRMTKLQFDLYGSSTDDAASSDAPPSHAAATEFASLGAYSAFMTVRGHARAHARRGARLRGYCDRRPRHRTRSWMS